MNRVLIVAPHPDDETLGAGGTLLKHRARGDEINWLIFTNMSTAGGWSNEAISQRKKEIEMVCDSYQFSSVHNLDYHAAELDLVPMRELIDSVCVVMKNIQPNILYVHNRSDIHSDHKKAFEAVYTCTKRFQSEFIRDVIMYETASQTELIPALPEYVFNPNLFIDITEYFEKKLEIFGLYKSEVANSIGGRSLEGVRALARYRGSRINRKYAESFQVLFQSR
jgi:LmbE family N-acetylglucosaminyl deacetylase